MSEMKVAVIDNGVDSRLVDCCQEVDLSEKHWTEASEKEKYGHGTVCAAIIKKYAPESEIVSLKVVDESAKRSVRKKLEKHDPKYQSVPKTTIS